MKSYGRTRHHHASRERWVRWGLLSKMVGFVIKVYPTCILMYPGVSCRICVSVSSKFEAPPVLHGLTRHSGRSRSREGRHRKERVRLALKRSKFDITQATCSLPTRGKAARKRAPYGRGAQTKHPSPSAYTASQREFRAVEMAPAWRAWSN